MKETVLLHLDKNGDPPPRVLAQSSRPLPDIIVTDVATNFRVEKENPLGEANRLIIALTATFVATRLNRIFRRYYVYEALDFTPERLVDTLRDMALDVAKAAKEIRAETGHSKPRRLKQKL
jgi:hypothetical protein